MRRPFGFSKPYKFMLVERLSQGATAEGVQARAAGPAPRSWCSRGLTRLALMNEGKSQALFFGEKAIQCMLLSVTRSSCAGMKPYICS